MWGYKKRSMQVYLQVHGFVTPLRVVTLTKTLASTNLAC